MRRSRSGLLLCLGTFATLLLAVGFADGGHQSPLRPAEMYRLDLDDPVDGWAEACRAWYGEASLTAAAQVSPPAVTEAAAGSDGWLGIQVPGAPIVVWLFIDDDTACLLSCPAADDCLAGIEADRASRLASAAAVEDIREVLATLFGTPELVEELETAAAAEDSSADNDLALNAAAACSGLSSQMFWHAAISRSVRCEFAWEGCDAYPDASMAGWLGESQSRGTAAVWRGIGVAAWEVVERLVDIRRDVVEAAYRGLATVIRQAPRTAERAAAEPIDSDLQPWPNLGRSTGSFLSL